MLNEQCLLCTQVVHVWTEARRSEGGGAVQAEGGGGGAGGGAEAADADEWHQPEQLHHKDSAKQYERFEIHSLIYFV